MSHVTKSDTFFRLICVKSGTSQGSLDLTQNRRYLATLKQPLPPLAHQILSNRNLVSLTAEACQCPTGNPLPHTKNFKTTPSLTYRYLSPMRYTKTSPHLMMSNKSKPFKGIILDCSKMNAARVVGSTKHFPPLDRALYFGEWDVYISW